MVVLSAAICTKTGKALVARQFVEMTRIRLEGLLSAFPKLLGTDSMQHTFVETESVRYVYLSLDTLYLVLVTNRASNIVEDLETLRLLSKVVPDIVGSSANLNEEKISEKCFELIFAIDEVITAGGYREPITLQQIRTNLEMESHEEKLHLMIKMSKMESAKDQARDAARIIKEKQKEAARSGMGGMGSMQGIGSASSSSSLGGMDSLSIPKSSPSPYESTGAGAASPGGSNLGLPKAGSQKAAPVKGMSLSAAGKGKSLEDALVKEDKLAPVRAVTKAGPASAEVAVAAPAAPVVQHPVMLVVAERITAKLSRDGTVHSFDVKGSLTLTANSDESALCSVQMRVGDVDAFTFSTHPKVNKAKYDRDGLIQLKDTTKGFPSARPVGILKWTHSSTAEDMVPFKVNCWPEEEARGLMNVSIEYTMDHPRLELHDVKVSIPLGTREVPSILNIDGNYKHSPSAEQLLWEIPLIDKSNSSGTLEFTIQSRNAGAFFPISINFASNILYCDIDVASVRTAEGEGAILYGISKSVLTEEYTVE